MISEQTVIHLINPEESEYNDSAFFDVGNYKHEVYATIFPNYKEKMHYMKAILKDGYDKQLGCIIVDFDLNNEAQTNSEMKTYAESFIEDINDICYKQDHPCNGRVIGPCVYNGKYSCEMYRHYNPACYYRNSDEYINRKIDEQIYL